MIVNEESRIHRIDNVVVVWPHFWQPHGLDPNKQYWSGEFLLDRNNPQHQQAYQECLRLTSVVLEQSGKKGIDPAAVCPMKPGENKNAQRASTGKAPRPELDGKWLLYAADGRNAPQVLAQDGSPMGEAQSGSMFSGCVVNVIVDYYWRKVPTNPGISSGLKGVQLVDNVNVERMGGGQLDVTSMFMGGSPAPLAQQPQNAGPAPVDQSQPYGTGAAPSWL